MSEKIQETQDLQVPITVDSQGNVDVKTNPSKKMVYIKNHLV